MRKILFLSIILGAFAQSCGNKNSSDGDGSIRAPVLNGSTNAGAYLAMSSPDTSVASTSLHWYDFATGAISRVSSAEGRDPVALWNSSTKTVVYVVRSSKIFRTFKIENGNPIDGKSGTMTDLDAGDPTAWLELSEGNFLVSNMRNRSLRVFESASGYLSNKIDASSLDVSTSGSFFAPVSMSQSHNLAANTSAPTSPWVLSSGLDVSGVTPTAKGPGTAFKYSKSGDTWTASDLNSTLAGTQGKTLDSTFPVYAEYTSAAKGLRVFGLCKSSYGSSCVSASDEIDISTGAVTKLANFSDLGYEHFSTIVPGADDDNVYAHVTHTASQTNMLVRINLKTKAVKEIVSFADSGLCLLMYDKGSDRLLVGWKENSAGYLAIYKAEVLESKVSTTDLPWHGTFVSSM